MLSSWCYEPSQPLEIIPGLRQHVGWHIPVVSLLRTTSIVECGWQVRAGLAAVLWSSRKGELCQGKICDLITCETCDSLY